VRVLERAHAPLARFVLGFLGLVGHPVFRFFVVEAEDGRLAATALLTFTSRAGYIGAVVVDTPYRGRGYARRVLERCHEAARRAGKPYTVLDVLQSNEPAQRLYLGMGYRPLRVNGFFSRALDSNGSAVPATDAGIRPFRRGDARALESIARDQLPPPVARVLPAEAEQFRIPPTIGRTLEAETEAWVALDAGSRRAAGFIRATVAPLTAAANLTAPYVGPSVSDDRGRALVRTALAWLRQRVRTSVVAEVPDHNPRGRAALEAEGFREAHRLDTLVRPTAE
jgi:ribosomal protein S18 acetylase RimI-like enzyme